MNPGTKRLSRHEIQEPDAFQTGMEQVVRFVRENRRKVTLAAGAGLVALVALVAALVWLRAREADAGAALGKLLELESRPVGSGPALPGTGAPFPDAAAKDNAILDETDAILGRHGSTRAARAARLLRAQALARRGQHAEANKLFRAVAGTNPGDALAATAAFGAAETQAASGEVDAAIAELTRLAASGNPNLPKDYALNAAANIAARAGQSETAAKLYRRVVAEAPGSPLASAAGRRAEELEQALPSISPAAPAESPAPAATP